MIRFIPSFSLVALGLLGCAEAHAEPHGPHIHGEADLAIVVEGDLVTIHLTSAMYNITGFEHAPETATQREVLSSAVATLNSPDRLFGFSAPANCRSISGLHSLQSDSGGASSHHDHAEDDADGHTDLESEYEFSCNNISRLQTIDVKLFEAFGNLEKVNAVVFLLDQQMAKELTPAKSTLSLLELSS